MNTPPFTSPLPALGFCIPFFQLALPTLKLSPLASKAQFLLKFSSGLSSFEGMNLVLFFFEGNNLGLHPSDLGFRQFRDSFNVCVLWHLICWFFNRLRNQSCLARFGCVLPCRTSSFRMLLRMFFAVFPCFLCNVETNSLRKY